MAINKEQYERLIKRLDAIQAEIEEIHQELLIGLESEDLTEDEQKEIKAIQKENDFRTIEEWQKEEPLDWEAFYYVDEPIFDLRTMNVIWLSPLIEL